MTERRPNEPGAVPEPGGLLTRPNDVGVHRALLTGFKNRLAALFNWTVAFLGRGRWQRVITAQQVFARRALEQQATVMPKVHAVEVGDEPRRV